MVVYLPLLNEGKPCWRPVEAERVEKDSYRILGNKPADEQWPVAKGDIVHCELRRFADGYEGLVVILPPASLPPIY